MRPVAGSRRPPLRWSLRLEEEGEVPRALRRLGQPHRLRLCRLRRRLEVALPRLDGALLERADARRHRLAVGRGHDRRLEQPRDLGGLWLDRLAAGVKGPVCEGRGRVAGVWRACGVGVRGGCAWRVWWRVAGSDHLRVGVGVRVRVRVAGSDHLALEAACLVDPRHQLSRSGVRGRRALACGTCLDMSLTCRGRILRRRALASQPHDPPVAAAQTLLREEHEALRLGGARDVRPAAKLDRVAAPLALVGRGDHLADAGPRARGRPSARERLLALRVCVLALCVCVCVCSRGVVATGVATRAAERRGRKRAGGRKRARPRPHESCRVAR